MQPLGISVQSELMSAMSAMNMRDDDGTREVYFTDMYKSVKDAHDICSSNIISPSEKTILKIINLIKKDDLNKKHFLLQHAIEHLESAIVALNK